MERLKKAKKVKLRLKSKKKKKIEVEMSKLGTGGFMHHVTDIRPPKACL